MQLAPNAIIALDYMCMHVCVCVWLLIDTTACGELCRCVHVQTVITLGRMANSCVFSLSAFRLV